MQAKIALLAKLAFGQDVALDKVPCAGISNLTIADFACAKVGYGAGYEIGTFFLRRFWLRRFGQRLKPYSLDGRKILCERCYRPTFSRPALTTVVVNLIVPLTFDETNCSS